MNEYFESMQELKLLMEEYVELTPYQILYEADKPDVSNQMQQNARIEKRSESVLSKAIHAIQRLIKNVISSIRSFIDQITMGKDEKKLFAQFKEEIKKHPEFANKKVTVKDFRSISQKYDEKINEVEKEIRDCMATHRPPSQQLMDNVKNFLKEGVTATTAILGTEVAVKAAQSNLGIAKEIQKQLNDHSEIMVQLEKALGKKEAKKFKKEIDKDAKEIGLHRMLVNLFAKKYENLRECITDTFSQVNQVSEGKIFGNLGFIKKFVTNKTFSPIVKQGAKMVASQQVGKVTGKVQQAKNKVGGFVSKNIINRSFDPTAQSAGDFIKNSINFD